MIVIFILLSHIVSSNLQTMIISSLGIDSCSAAQSLTVSSDSDCVKIQERGWKSITVNSGLCNSMRGSLSISNYPCLQSIEINSNSLQNLNSLVISNNPQLNSIVTKDSALYYVQSVTISSIF